MNLIIEKLPETLEEFQALLQFDLTKPENSCALFLCALNLFTKDQELGITAINLLKGPVVLNPFDISFLKDRLKDKPYLPLAYFDGAIPDNNYQPSLPYTLTFFDDQRPQDIEAGYLRLYLKTAGADSARAIKLREKEGNWYIWDYPGILMDIRKPKKDLEW